MKKYIILAILLLSPINAWSATYYFSSSAGSNTTGDGSINNPWANFTGKKNGTNALSPGDFCLFKAGDIWYHQELIVDSNGSAGNPITIDRYGAGSDPIFCWASTVSGWTYTGTTGVYKKIGLMQYNGTVGVDGLYALQAQDWAGKTVGTTIDAGCFLPSNATGDGFHYIRLPDNSDPNNHTIYIPTSSQSDVNRGIVRGSNSKGSYVNINHIQVWYANGKGFSFSQPHSNFNDCTAMGCGHDGFLLNGYTPGGEMASYCTINRATVTYCMMAQNSGQAITIGSDHCWVKNSVIHDNVAAGIDFLDYGTDTDVHHGGAIYNTVYNNGDAIGNSGYHDPQIYSDGAHDILFYGNIVYGASGATNMGDGIVASSEHASKPVYNIHIINNLVYDTPQGYGVIINKGGDWPSYNNGTSTVGNTVVNNTIVRGSGGYGGTLFLSGLGTSTKTIVKNNILYRTAGSYPDLMWDSSITSSTCDMDYNIFYDPNKTNVISDNDGSSGNYTLAQWQSNRGLDLNSIQSNPNLVDTTISTFDARLTVATSPAINAGVNSPWTPPSWISDAAVLADNGAVVGTTRPDGVVDSGTLDIGFHYYAPTPTGSLTSTNVQPTTLYLNTVNTDTITFTTANTIPSDGKIVITYPISLGGGFTFNSSGTSTASFNSGGSGSLAVSISGANVTLTRSGGSSIAAGQVVSISLTNVLNPPQVGNTGPYEIKTTTSADSIIDIDQNVSADQIISPSQGFTPMTFGGCRAIGIKFS